MNFERLTWEEIPPLVESIISARTLKTRTARKLWARGKTVGDTTVTTERPFPFQNFSKEVGINNARAYRYIRGGLIPKEPMKEKILAWCKKHFGVLKK